MFLGVKFNKEPEYFISFLRTRLYFAVKHHCLHRQYIHDFRQELFEPDSIGYVGWKYHQYIGNDVASVSEPKIVENRVRSRSEHQNRQNCDTKLNIFMFLAES